MATEYVLSFRDLRPLGSAEQLQALIRKVFPDVRFGWTTSGLEKLQIAKERGIELPPPIRQGLESLPSLLEGVAEGDGWRVMFGLGHKNPITELILEPRGEHASMEQWIAEIETALGTRFRIHGEPASE